MIFETGILSGRPSVMWIHLDSKLEMLLFLKIPPLTPPAKTVSLDESFGSNITPLVLPPTFDGPLETHFISFDSPGTREFSDMFSLSNFFLYCNANNL